MPPAPTTGKKAKVVFTPAGVGATPITLKNQTWTVSPEDNLVRGYNTSDGIFRAAGVPDITGTITGPIDTATLISTQITRYATGNLDLYLTDTIIAYTIADAILGMPTVNPNGENDLATWSVTFAIHTGDYEIFPAP
jgi:hypothetical protein